MKSRLTFWFALGLSVALGALIWIYSQRFTGKAEPWDGSGYYWHFSLVAAGFFPALLSPRRFWLWPFCVLLGQVIIFAVRAIQGPPSALWPVGLIFLALYTVLSFVGAFIGWASRRFMGKLSDSTTAP